VKRGKKKKPATRVAKMDHILETPYKTLGELEKRGTTPMGKDTGAKTG